MPRTRPRFFQKNKAKTTRPEHAQNTPQIFFKKLKQKQHAQNTPQIFFSKMKQKQHAPKNEAKPTHPDHAQNTPHIFLKINMPINAISVILLLFSTCLATRPRTRPEHARNTPGTRPEHARNTPQFY